MFNVLWMSVLLGCGESGLNLPLMGAPCDDCWDTGQEQWNRITGGLLLVRAACMTGPISESHLVPPKIWKKVNL